MAGFFFYAIFYLFFNHIFLVSFIYNKHSEVISMQIPQMGQFPAMQSGFGQMAPIGDIVWVQSVDQLGALNLPPNVSRLYMNSGEAEFYIVTTDKIGMKSITTYTFSEKPKAAPVEYVTMSELDRFKAELINVLKEAHYESNSDKQSGAWSDKQSAKTGRLGNYQTENKSGIPA